MRLLCFGDLHLGASPDLGREPYGPNSRLADQAKVLKQIAALAADEQVDAVLFAGDAFHRRRPTPSEILVWRWFVDRLDDETIPIIAIDGNHDVISSDLPSALETVKPRANYEVSRAPQVFPLRAGQDRVMVCTLPWAPPARLVAAWNGGGDRDRLHHDAAMLLVEGAAEIRSTANFREGGRAKLILLAHWSVSGASTPTGVYTDEFREPVIPLEELAAQGWDAIVLGHIHKPQTLREFVFYTGSPCVVDWGEADSEHGVWILNTDEPKWAQFHPIEDRPFHTFNYDLSLEQHPWLGAATLADLVMEIAAVEGEILRLRYTATREQASRIDHQQIRQALLDAGAAKVIIQPTVLHDQRARVEGVDETVEPLEALRMWAQANDVPADVLPRLAERTAGWLQEARG